MHVITHADAAAFLAAARTELEAAEAFNGLILGLATRLERQAREGGADVHGEAESPRFFTVEAEGRQYLAALQTPPRKVIVHGADAWESGVETLVAHLARLDPRPPGVLGPRPVAEGLARAWQARCGGAVETGMMMGVYELRRVEYPGVTPGALRAATAGDLELLTDWVTDFNEVVHEDMPEGREGVRREVRHLLDGGQVYLWEDGGRPVCLARWGRPTAHGACVTTVYTPPSLRRRGYATCCVAALSQLLLDRGNAFCTLFTDLANPTSNHIYQQVGYRRLGDFGQYDFTAAETEPGASGRNSPNG